MVMEIVNQRAVSGFCKILISDTVSGISQFSAARAPEHVLCHRIDKL